MKPTVITGKPWKEKRCGGPWGTCMVYIYPTDAGNFSVQELADIIGWSRQHMQNKLGKFPEINDPRVFQVGVVGSAPGKRKPYNLSARREKINSKIIQEWREKL